MLEPVKTCKVAEVVLIGLHCDWLAGLSALMLPRREKLGLDLFFTEGGKSKLTMDGFEEHLPDEVRKVQKCCPRPCIRLAFSTPVYWAHRQQSFPPSSPHPLQ